MKKTPEEMAQEYGFAAQKRRANYGNYWIMDEVNIAKDGFLAGYKAAKAIVEDELQTVQAQRAEYPGLGAAQYALKNVLAKMGEL